MVSGRWVGGSVGRWVGSRWVGGRRFLIKPIFSLDQLINAKWKLSFNLHINCNWLEMTPVA